MQLEKGSRIPQLHKSATGVSTKSSDMKKRKKVKFLDPVNSQDLPSSRRGRVQSPNDCDAKTSEFKSFTRLLGETNRKRMPRHDNNLKTFEVTECMRDNDSIDKDNRNSFLSPVIKVASDCWRSCISPAETSLICGPEHEYEGIFLKKRKKLQQLAAEASSCKLDVMLSNKSDLIQKFLQRLVTRRKSDNPDEHPKPTEKFPCGRHGMPISLTAYGDYKNVQETVKADNQRSLRRKQEIGLLTDRYSEADEQIALPVDYVKYQDLPNFHALEAGSVCHRWQSIPVSGDKRESCLYAENKVASSIDLGWYQNEHNMLFTGDELVTLPQDYPMVHLFSTSNDSDSGLQAIHWHPNPNSVDEGIIENKSASTRYFPVGCTVPKVDRFICDHAELQSFPAWKSLDTDPKGRKRSSGSISTGYCMMDRLLYKDDELITLPSDVMLQSIPARHATQTGAQGKNKCSISVLGGIPSLHTEMELEITKCGLRSDGDMLSNYGHWTPNNFPTGGEANNYSIVRYFDSGSSSDLGGRDFYSEVAKEQCSLPLLRWSGSIEPELPDNSAGEHSKGLDYLPLMLYGASDKLDTTESHIACRGRNIFNSVPRYSHISPPTSDIELEGDSLEHWWSSYAKYPLDKKMEDGGFGHSAARNTHDDFENTQSYFPADFPYLQRKFSVDGEKSIFDLLPERLRWHWP